MIKYFAVVSALLWQIGDKLKMQLHTFFGPIVKQISVRHSIAMFILYSFLAAPLIKADIDIYGNGGIFDIFSFLFVVFFAS